MTSTSFVTAQDLTQAYRKKDLQILHAAWPLVHPELYPLRSLPAEVGSVDHFARRTRQEGTQNRPVLPGKTDIKNIFPVGFRFFHQIKVSTGISSHLLGMAIRKAKTKSRN